MKTIREDPSLLAEKILEAEAKLERLEQAVGEIGQPAGHELRRRLDNLRIEENALKRNFEESRRRGEPDSVRMEKIEVLLRHIEQEESSVGHEVDFLHQSAPSSVTLAVEAGSHLVDVFRHGMKRVIGNHLPLGESVFVNHSHANLTSQYGLNEPETPNTAPDPANS
jgi:hypothetical protein